MVVDRPGSRKGDDGIDPGHVWEYMPDGPSGWPAQKEAAGSLALAVGCRPPEAPRTSSPPAGVDFGLRCLTVDEPIGLRLSTRIDFHCAGGPACRCTTRSGRSRQNGGERW